MEAAGQLLSLPLFMPKSYCVNTVSNTGISTYYSALIYVLTVAKDGEI